MPRAVDPILAAWGMHCNACFMSQRHHKSQQCCSVLGRCQGQHVMLLCMWVHVGWLSCRADEDSSKHYCVSTG